MKVAILGPRGTFSEEAASLLEKNAELLLSLDIEEVFSRVISGSVDFGIVPAENSLEGPIGMTSELLLTEDVKIYREIVLDICHSLLALESTDIGGITEIISHPHALAQCKGALKGLNVKTKNFSSTAEAAKEVSEKKLKNTAAIAPKVSADLYGLKILKEDMQDEDINQTRFFVIAKRDHEVTQNDKTSLIIGLKDKPGALYEALKSFSEKNINLTKIESRPSRKALGDYIFYIDLEGHRKDKAVREVLDKLRENTAFLKVLGSYPKFSP
ncbi:MAG: prephenate dehydratase [Candidatus Hydrothermarchaeaceae archaeon]